MFISLFILLLKYINTSTGWTVYDAVVWLIMTGAAEPGVHRVQVHPHILPGKEAKPVPSKYLVLIHICTPRSSDYPSPLNKQMPF
jgi:hypothetical protein